MWFIKNVFPFFILTVCSLPVKTIYKVVSSSKADYSLFKRLLPPKRKKKYRLILVTVLHKKVKKS